ncbi:acetyl-CoA carboxylase biotin carboxyl carrier protein subunit [Aedoeadaptatus pacaensis]|uniref:acetyl-CoA carboxylase biotin carboxyl carrier protein subunit n=1 Tax=Aedoeadaptatus pacaensis TaxID=1776390 RepID=UPI000837EF97|nr:acetyl-CoA carboxylase biotin carboxyl carrier protein subunit [Peptoniphilus pacaensis]
MIICAPLPGKIIRLHVKSNESVAKGRLLFTMESMKMTLPVCSPEAGKIAYEVAEGDIVTKGEIIARVEPA